MLLLILVVLAAVIWGVSTVNGFQKKDLKVQESLSGIEVALTKRYDTLTKMLDVAKGYAKHEKEVFSQSIQLRKGMPIGQLNQAQQQMDQMMGAIQVTAEAYPSLGADKVFIKLQESILDAEEHLQAARRLYNANVTAYNTAISMIPGKFLAGGRTPQELFVAESHKRADVSMEF